MALQPLDRRDRASAFGYGIEWARQAARGDAVLGAGTGGLPLVANDSQIRLRLLAVVAPDDAVLAAYPGVRAWHERRRAEILPHWRKNLPYVATTAAGRKRIIHPLLVEREAKPYEYEQDASGRRRLRLGAMVRRALNCEVQGLCADGLKRAMILAHHRLPAEARQVLTIHDEIVLRVPAPMAEDCSSILRDAMVGGMTSVLPDGKSVPIEVEPVIVERWGEAK